MNFWTNRAYSRPYQSPFTQGDYTKPWFQSQGPSVGDTPTVYEPPKQFPWQWFAQPTGPQTSWVPPGLRAMEEAGDDRGDPITNMRPRPVGRPGPGPIDKNPNRPGNGWGPGGRPGNPGKHLGVGGGGGYDLISHNIRHALPDKVDKAILLNLISKNPNFIALQERGSMKDKAFFKRILNRHGYGLAGWNSRTGTPIAFKKGGRYKILEIGQRKVGRAGYVGPGAGPSRLGPKFANYIVARDRKTGKERAIINTHLYASQQHALRNKLAKKQMRLTAKLGRDLERKYGKDLARYIMGDMNTSKYGKLKKHGLGLNPYRPKGATHSGGGRIDWFLSDAGLRNVGQFNTRSDHHALYANFGRPGGKGIPMPKGVRRRRGKWKN